MERSVPWVAALALAVVVALGLYGDPDGARAPAAAASAAALLPPGARVKELALEGGGLLRAPSLREGATGGIDVYVYGSWRHLAGLTAEGPIRERRLWLGTDQQGRDVVARAAIGARASLSAALVAALVAAALGTFVGVATAVAPGGIGAALRWAVDGIVGIPRILVVLSLGLALRQVPGGVGVAVGLATWMGVARLLEAESRALLERPFVEAARAVGAGSGRIARHLVPHLGPLIVAAVPLVATDAVLLESTFAFLGVGVGAGASSWGAMVADAQRAGGAGWWIALPPGVLLTGTGLAFHALAERLGGGARPAEKREYQEPA